MTKKTLQERYSEYAGRKWLYDGAVKHLKKMQDIVEKDETIDAANWELLVSKSGIAGLGFGTSIPSNANKNTLKENWGKLRTKLQAIKNAKDDGTVISAIEGLSKYLEEVKGNALNLLTRRMVVTMRPHELFSILDIKDLKTLHCLLRKQYGAKFEDYPNSSDHDTWYKLNKTLFAFVNNQIETNTKDFTLCCMGWHLKETLIHAEQIKNLLETNKNIVLTGAPGTGKTYLAKEIARAMTKDNKDHWKMVQFHPSYDYTDFVEGLRPISKNGNIGFERRDGAFKTFCKKALKAPKETFVFIIDEINRGELSKIFGELFFSIDPGYRGKEGRVMTQYQNLVVEGDEFKDGLFVPDNVYIIGTMNDIDRSVESMDFAIRRRFAWHEVKWEDTFDSILASADSEALAKVSNVKDRFKALNEKITEELGEEFCIGGSYLCKLENYKGEEKPLQALWNNHIKGVVKEYLRGNPDLKIEDYEKAFLGKKKDSNNQATQET